MSEMLIRLALTTAPVLAVVCLWYIERRRTMQAFERLTEETSALLAQIGANTSKLAALLTQGRGLAAGAAHGAALASPPPTAAPTDQASEAEPQPDYAARVAAFLRMADELAASTTAPVDSAQDIRDMRGERVPP